MRGTIARKLRKLARINSAGKRSQLMRNTKTGEIFWQGERRLYKKLKYLYTNTTGTIKAKV